MLNLDQFKSKAIEFAATLKAGDVLLLNGPMGAGKTTFVGALTSFFNYYDASSPSFTLVNHYPTTIPILHMDLYRCTSESDILLLDLDHYFAKVDHIIIIEWAQKAPWLNKQCNYLIDIVVNNDQTRQLSIQHQDKATR